MPVSMKVMRQSSTSLSSGLMSPFGSDSVKLFDMQSR
jgi:hypothetical protein